jgi:hypothetical protein
MLARPWLTPTSPASRPSIAASTPAFITTTATSNMVEIQPLTGTERTRIGTLN